MATIEPASDGDLPDDLLAADVLAEDDVNGFAANVEIGGERPMTGSQVVHGDDFYLADETTGIDRYVIGDTVHIVHGGQCFVEDRGDNEDVDDMFVPAEPARGAPLGEVPVTGLAEIDGEEVYVIQVDELSTVYVSTETGYRVRDE